MPLTDFARLRARSGCEEDRAVLRRTLPAPTRAEQGCSTYDLHRSRGGPGPFVFTEAWDNRPLRDAHMTSPHLETFGDKQDATIETSELLTGETV